MCSSGKNIQKDSRLSIYYDDYTSNLLKELDEQLRGKDIYEMTTQELEAVRDTMKSFQHAIENANRIFLGDHNASLTETAQQWGKEISDVNVGFIRKYMNPASRFMQWQMSPDTMFMAFSGFAKNSVGEQVQKMFSKGTQRKIQVDTEYYNQFAPIMENNQNRKELNRLLGNPAKKKNLVDVGLKDRNGDSVQITRGMAMQLYMLLGQRDSLEALVYSGLKVPNMRKYYTDRSNAYGDIELSKARTSALGESAFELYEQIRNGEHALKRGEFGNMSEAELREKLDGMRSRLNDLVMGEEARLLEMRNSIEGMLTPLEKQCIEAARKWYARSGELMADTHEEMHGFRPRLIDDYVPIHRNGETVWTDKAARYQKYGRIHSMEILNTFVNPVIVCFCLVVGYAIKHLLPKVSNRIIPTVVVIVGIVVALWINQWAVITPDIILSGALSGLASTGLHQLFKQWIDGGGKVDKQ